MLRGKGEMADNGGKLAVSVHAGRIAPLFDVSERLELFELQGGAAVPAGALVLSGRTLPDRLALIGEQGIEALICGAMSGYAYNALLAKGIQVIPWTCGSADTVVNAYLTDALGQGRGLMPGAGARRFGVGRCGHRWRGGGRGRGRGRRGPAPPFGQMS